MNSKGKVVVKRRCKASKGQSPLSADTISGLATSQTGPQGPQGIQGPAGPAGVDGKDGDSAVLCYAKMDAVGTVLSYGGKGTTNVTTQGAGGSYDITCTGSYPGLTHYNDVTAVGSVESSHTSAGFTVDEADASHILVHVTCRTISSGNLSTCYHSFSAMGTTE